MHPSFYYRWKRSQQSHGGEAYAHACGDGGWRRQRAAERRSAYHAADFGVRRPLRYMAHKLDLDDEQIDTLAAILNVMKTERAQARLDERRSIAGLADALGEDTFDRDQAAKALDARVEAAKRLKDEVLNTLDKTHAMLDAEQRKRLAYLLRSGQLTI